VRVAVKTAAERSFIATMKNDANFVIADAGITSRLAPDLEKGGDISFSAVERDAVYRLIHARRDIREFSTEPIPEPVLWRILQAAHAAPSVGLSQPWHFVVLTSRKIREEVKRSFLAVNEEQKSRIGGGERGSLYSSLKLEGILESPLNLAVVCDPGAQGEFVLGRSPMPETAPYSVCLAIQNLWLAARAEGIGVGWVSILEKDKLEELLRLPERSELVAYLCLGYPKEFRRRPLLEEVGWKRPDKLETHVFHDFWGEPYELEVQTEIKNPAARPQGMGNKDRLLVRCAHPDSGAIRATLTPTLSQSEMDMPAARPQGIEFNGDHRQSVQLPGIPWGEVARRKLDNKTKPPGSLGKLEGIAIRLAEMRQTLEPMVDRQRILIFAANHGITAEGVSPYPSVVTEQMVANFLEGGAAINVLARHAGIELKIIDAGVGGAWTEEQKKHADFVICPVRHGTRNFSQEPAMTPEEAKRAIELGRQQIRAGIAEGVQLLGLGEMGIGNTTSASALAAALLRLTPDAVAGRGTGATDEILERKQRVIAAALKKYAIAENCSPERGLHWLQTVGGFEIAAMTGAILEAAKQRCPIVIDGFIATAAVLVAWDLDPECLQVCFFAHCSHEQAHREVLRRMGVEPLLQLDMRLGEGTGVALAMPIIAAAAKILNEMATFKSAGVSNLSEEEKT
jgi:nicotinate-nucleotide--dimethylbenzimidazole phosphoribosyltransferase